MTQDHHVMTAPEPYHELCKLVGVLSPFERAYFRAFIESGVTVEQIAFRLNKPVDAVRRMACNMTLDGFSDLMLAMGREPELSVKEAA